MSIAVGVRLRASHRRIFTGKASEPGDYLALIRVK